MTFAKKVQDLFKKLQANPQLRRARRLIILVFGLTIMLIGIAMIVLPGPALIVIPLSLAILGTEFLWARRLLKNILHQTERFKKILPGHLKKESKK